MKHVPTHDAAFICYALKRQGVAQVDVATELDLRPVTIWSVINGKSRSKRVESYIAKKTGERLHALWPQWYGPDDKPIRKRKPWRRITATDISALSNLEAA